MFATCAAHVARVGPTDSITAWGSRAWTALSAWPPCYLSDLEPRGPVGVNGGGAGAGLRTRYLDLGKVALYQVSYSRSARSNDFTRPGVAGQSRRQRRPARREPPAQSISQLVHSQSRLVEAGS